LLRDFNQAEETVIVPDAVGLPEIVTLLAWSSDGSQLALVGSNGGVYVARSDTWVCRRLPGIAAFIDHVRWIEDRDLACWGRDETSLDQTLFVVSPISEEVTRLSPPTTPRVIPDLGPIAAVPQSAAVPYDWYRYQGAWDSGAMAHSNCGPTCVAMAIQYARDNLWVPISTIRDYIGGSSWTYPSHLQSALDYWGVPNQRLYSMQDIHDAVALRGSIVLVHLWMYWFTPGSDYLASYSDPLQHYGRYYSYDQSHWVVFKVSHQMVPGGSATTPTSGMAPACTGTRMAHPRARTATICTLNSSTPSPITAIRPSRSMLLPVPRLRPPLHLPPL